MYSVTVLLHLFSMCFAAQSKTLFLLSCFCNLFCAVSGTGLHLLSGTKFLQRGLGNCAVRCQAKLGAAQERLKRTAIIYRLELRRMFSCLVNQVLQRARKTSGTGFCELSQVRSSGNLQKCNVWNFCNVECSRRLEDVKVRTLAEYVSNRMGPFKWLQNFRWKKKCNFENGLG